MVKTEKLSVKLLHSHKEALERIAMADGEPMAVVVRGLIRNEATRRGMWLPRENTQSGRQGLRCGVEGVSPP
jgi:hypothetical protein